MTHQNGCKQDGRVRNVVCRGPRENAGRSAFGFEDKKDSRKLGFNKTADP